MVMRPPRHPFDVGGYWQDTIDNAVILMFMTFAWLTLDFAIELLSWSQVSTVCLGVVPSLIFYALESIVDDYVGMPSTGIQMCICAICGGCTEYLWVGAPDTLRGVLLNIAMTFGVTRCCIGLYEEVRPLLCKELLSQEKKKRERGSL